MKCGLFQVRALHYDLDFCLASLGGYAGRRLVFFWHPLDFTVLCPAEITALSDRLDEFNGREADMLGASTDSVYSHRVWMQTPRDRQGIMGLRFPLLSD